MTSKNIHQRIAAAMQKVDYIQKEKKPGMRYTIVSHDAVTAKVRPVLLENGIVYYPVDLHQDQVGNRTQVRLTVRFANIDDPKDCIDVPSLGYGIDDQDKGPGKAISYAVKYALLKTLGLETGDDADLEQDVVHRNDEPATPIRQMVTDKDQQFFAEAMKTAAATARTQQELDDCWREHQRQMNAIGIVKATPLYKELADYFGKLKSAMQKEAA